MSLPAKLLFAILFFHSFAVKSQDLSLYLKKEFTSPEGSVLAYRILYPEGYDQKKRYPLVLVLHGAGERGSDNEKQLAHGAKLFLNSLARKNYPAIVVFPQCPTDSYWSSVTIDRTASPPSFAFNYTNPITTPLRDAMLLVGKLTSDEAVDKNRIYITGLSMGGMGTFEAVHRYPSVFAAALPICGGGDTLRYNKVSIPFWIFHGTDDAVVKASYSQSMVEKLKELKVDVQYTEYPGVKHNSWDYAFAEPQFLKWMFSKQRR